MAAKTVRISALLFVLNSTFSHADSLDELFDLSLEELLSVKVSLASASEEELAQTPAIVSRYTRSDLESMGVTTLKEMFNFVPGVVVQYSVPGWASVQIRGVDETFNQKVLFLLNGVPYHQPSHSIVPMEGIPWESISHVEVIRGPGAVFHGTQASGGVFNVVTRTDQEDTIRLTTDNDLLKEGSVYLSKDFSDNTRVDIAAEIYREDSYGVTYNAKFQDVGVITDTIQRSLEKESLIANLTANDTSVDFHTFSSRTVGINDVYTDENTLQPFILESTGYLIHSNHTWSTEQSETTLFADYNHYTFDLIIENALGVGTHAVANKGKEKDKDYRARVGLKNLFKISERLSIASGAENETRSFGGYGFYFLNDQKGDPLISLFESNKIDEFSAYSEIDYTSKNWRFLIGGRYTNNELNGDRLTPRLAAVYKIDDQQTIKAIHSVGFNSPNAVQTQIYLPGDILGNKNLTAEVVKSSDIAYSYTSQHVMFIANIYQMKSEDFILRRYSEEVSSVTFFNEGNYERTGAELDLHVQFSFGKLFANLAYQADGNKQREDDIEAFRIPKFTYSLGFSSTLTNNDSVGGNISYIGERQNLDAYTVVNLNYNAEFNGFDIFINIRNLLDEKILNPASGLQSQELYAPEKEGTNVQIGTRIYF